MQSIQHGLLSNLDHKNGRCQRIRAVCSRTCHLRHSHRRAHLCWRKGALPMNCRPTWIGERVCATNGIQRRRDNQRKTDEATCLKGKPHSPQSNCPRSKWCINKTPFHAHDANNHTMDTTGTCNPQKLRWYALTWKPTANGEHPTPTKQAMFHNSSDAAQKTRTQ